MWGREGEGSPEDLRQFPGFSGHCLPRSLQRPAVTLAQPPWSQIPLWLQALQVRPLKDMNGDPVKGPLGGSVSGLPVPQAGDWSSQPHTCISRGCPSCTLTSSDHPVSLQPLPVLSPYKSPPSIQAVQALGHGTATSPG